MDPTQSGHGTAAFEAALAILGRKGGATESELGATLPETNDPLQSQVSDLARRAWALCVLDRLEPRGLLRRVLSRDGTRIATLQPLGAPGAFGARPPDGPWVLSRFAVLRRDDDGLVVECGLGHAAVVLHDEHAAAFVASLTSPRVPASGTERALCELLDRARAAGPAIEGECEHDRAPALRTWEPHDLYFHSRTRAGRVGRAMGGTFRFEGVLPDPPPELPFERPRIMLERAPAATSDPGLWKVLSTRRSMRTWDGTLTVGELGRFLHRVVGESPALQRPHPSAGARFPLRIWIAAERCEGLESGLYVHLPETHELGLVIARNARVDALFDRAGRYSEAGVRPPVLVILAARFARLAWKYEAVAYALLLKEVGVVLQTMCVVAHGLGLGTCILGGGGSDEFAAASGCDYLVEGSVGELMLGNVGKDQG
jgi:SagB-type dehydrogenase family enzyme